MASPSISVAMATYNGERFIREQLESILAQTIVPTEIVVTDDQSTDSTVHIVRNVLSDEVCRDRGVTLTLRVNEKNLGPGENFRHAISLCSGEFIALADQDDLWFPRKLEVLLSEFGADESLLLVHSDARLIDAGGSELPMVLSRGLSMTDAERAAIESGYSLPAIIKRNLVTGTTAIFRRELGELAFQGPTVDLHDGRLAIVASVMDALRFVPLELVGYRQHDANEIGGKPLSLVDTVVALMKSWDDLTAVLAERNKELEDLLGQLGDRVPAQNAIIVRERISHNAWRIGLPSSRILRIWPVLWGALNGRYGRFGRFPHDFTRDMVMPPREVLLGVLRSFTRRSF